MAKAKGARIQKMPQEWILDQAGTMLATFEAVEVERFDLTLATEDRHAAVYVQGMTIKKLRRALSALFERCEREHLNFIIRPRFSRECRLVQLDDLNFEQAQKICGYSFLAIETSPANYQVWLAVGDKDADFARRLKR